MKRDILEDVFIDLIVITAPIVTGLVLFKDVILRKLGIKQVLIVYFSDEDYESAYTLKKFFGIRADMVRLSPAATTLPPEADEYKYIILLGGQAINPFYKKYMEAGYLPEIKYPGQYVIRQIGNLIFIAGYEKEDTFKAVQEFIKALSK